MSSAARPRPRVRDVQRSRVYAAEEAWEARLDAARRGARRAVVGGSTVLLPEELRFGTLEAAGAYADRLTSREGLPPVTVRVGRGRRRATWSEDDQIALPVPMHGEPWALRESVLLHELAHHATWHRHGAAGHGRDYAVTMLDLVATALGPEAALALRIDYEEHRVQCT